MFKATVSRVSPVVDAASRTKEIILNFDKRDSRINAGMFAKVTLYTRDFTDAVVMPSDSVVTKDSKQYAYVVRQDNTAEQREIVLGNAVDGMVQILKGVKAGELIIVEGQTSLSDGAKIRDITNGLPQDDATTADRSEKRGENPERAGKSERAENPPVAEKSAPQEPKAASDTEQKSSDVAQAPKKRSWGGMSSTGSR